MNGTHEETAERDPLEIAQEAHKLFRGAGIRAQEATDRGDPILADHAEADTAFYATATLLHVAFSIAVDLRRIANALERKP